MASRTRPTLSQVLDEPSIELLWPRAALMQLANTAIAQTEVDSGVYGNRGAQRWQATIAYLRVIASSDDESVGLLVREVNRIHARVKVPVGASSGVRPVFDPVNQMWVAATWFQSMIDTYRLVVGEIDDDWLDTLLADFARAGAVLQMKTADWPSTFRDFESYVRGQEMRYPLHLPRSAPDTSPECLAAGDIAVDVFSTYSLPRRRVKSIPVVRLLSWGMAGELLREVYGTPWTPEHQARFEVEARRLRRRNARRAGWWRRRSAVRARRRTESKLRGHSDPSYVDYKALEARRARTET